MMFTLRNEAGLSLRQFKQKTWLGSVWKSTELDLRCAPGWHGTSQPWFTAWGATSNILRKKPFFNQTEVFCLEKAWRYIPYSSSSPEKWDVIPPGMPVPKMDALTSPLGLLHALVFWFLNWRGKKKKKKQKCGFPWRQLFCSKIWGQASSVFCVLMQMLGFNFRGRVGWGWWLGAELFGGEIFLVWGCVLHNSGGFSWKGGRKPFSVFCKEIFWWGKKNIPWGWWNHLGHNQHLSMSIMEDPAYTWHVPLPRGRRQVSSPGRKALEKLEMSLHSQECCDEGSGEEKGPWATVCFCFPHICSLGRDFTSSIMMCWVLHSGSWALDTLGLNWLAFHGLDCSSFKELQGVRSRRWQETLALHLESWVNDLCAGKN